jgi:hypothetical protein
MEVLNSGVFGGIFILGFLEFTMKRISCLLPILAAASFSYAAVNLGVSLSDSIKPVTHVATGSLYGLTETLPSDITKDVAPLKPNVFLSPARSGNGRQQGIGGAFLVAPRVESIGAKIQIRLADVLPGWPYKFQNMNHWKNEVTSVINDKLKSNNKNFDGYEIWNEPDGTWKNENGDFNSVLWKQTYDLIRKLDPTAKIIGPSYSYYSSSRMDAFVKYCAQNNCMPDVISWHQWGSANFVNTVESYRSIEKKYNVSPRPFSINEYSSEVHEEEGCPGVSVPFIAKFERYGVESAMISWWFVPLPGRLGSLLTKNNERGGGWWLYKWYGDMSGYMAKVTPPNDKSDGVDGFAALDKKKGFASIVLGGNTRGDVNVNISGIPESFGNKVNVDVEYVTWENKDKAVPSTTLESSKEYDVSGGKITVPVNIKNVKYGYRVYVTAIVPQAPYKDTAMAIPGKVEVENYDVGGPGKAFLDKDDDNKGGEYRDDAVDIVKVADGYAVGYTQEGEWLEYTVNVAESQEYALSIRYATTSENVGAKLYVDDKAVLEEVTFPKGTDWDTYAVHEAGMVSLSAGKHVLKLEIVGNYVNIDWLDFADSKTTAVKGTRMLPLVTQRRAAYSVFDTQGRFVASFTAVGDEEASVKVYAAVKHAGLYLVKPQSGGRMFRMSVK